MVDLAFAPPGRTGRGPLCPTAVTRAALSVLAETTASRQKQQRRRLPERVVKVLRFRESGSERRRDALRWIPRRERHRYHVEITALIDGLLAAARGGSPSVKLAR